ncbi:tyrosine--tRNA ligase [Acidiferrimicrobium sp. IK]|uniref:tyrosine--tRNA ligase n=1 Tax=Acidiferrimicrobium sp. IK TaxID=2871700 RepID=UPI0021CB1ED3|nr:tyrosine--tRNA ligase [Acidiferrimicrobium sp. IK]MCU4184890.1 tyrosine--tRNA ligase [Acidiferrimicrobium sp. IK]
MTSLIDDLRWRGLVHQMTDDRLLPELLAGGQVTGYIGFDPTADSLHVGHLQQILLLRRLQDAGHRPVALVGGGTGMIGDPGGRSEERNLLDEATLTANREGIRAQLERFMEFGATGAILEDNVAWLGTVGLLEFLRDVGKLFTVNEMVRKDSVRTRIEGRDQGLSFTEFSYMLLQAWDYLQLFDRHGCRLQLGGSDQWGNITEGVDLVRKRRSAQVFGLTSPLVLKADGTKFGKSETGTVWLDPARTSPYAYFQFWLRTDDAEVGSYLRRMTLLPRDAIAALDEAAAAHPERREAQRALAREVTTLTHGAAETARAEQAAAVLYSEDIAALDEATLAAALEDAPTASITPAELDGGLTVIDALVRSALVRSTSEARAMLAQGAVYVANRPVADNRGLEPADALHGRFVVLRRGKRAMAVLVVAR